MEKKNKRDQTINFLDELAFNIIILKQELLMDNCNPSKVFNCFLDFLSR